MALTSVTAPKFETFRNQPRRIVTMLQVAILTLALLNGDCPECGRAYGPPGVYGPGSVTYGRLGYGIGTPWTVRPILPRAAIVQTIPRPVVGCVGQNCYSTYRPPVPGIPSFDYRTDFNYPWSQAPCALYPRHGSDVELNLPEVVPAPPALEARRKSTATIKARRGSVVVSDEKQRASTRR
jgi:hypothetical protein